VTVAGPRPQVIAHRGASGEAPENTLAAFHRALTLGVDGVELDVHLSADAEPVVLHDPLLERTTDGRGLVGAHSLTELRRLDAGRWFGEAFAGERIPTLAEALTFLRPGRVIVEIKSGPVRYPGIAQRVTAVIRDSGHPAVTISSFDHEVLREVRAAAPSLPTAVLYVARPVDPLRLARDAGASILHPQWAHLHTDLVERAHAAGLRVETWVVDEPEHLALVVAMGVDGVMTNYPDRLRAVLGNLGYALPLPVTS
jgi:glycerophosphoryl diester phosphodiesterase